MKFHLQSGIKEFIGKDGKVTEAVLSSGTRLPADVCILGVGRWIFSSFTLNESHREKTSFLHMRKQRRRSESR